MKGSRKSNKVTNGSKAEAGTSSIDIDENNPYSKRNTLEAVNSEEEKLMVIPLYKTSFN